MYPLFETICIADGQIQNGHYHKLRFIASYVAYFGKKPGYSLFDDLIIPELSTSFTYKLRISYNETGTSHTISAYHHKIPKSLRLIQDDTIYYHLKYSDRNGLDLLYTKRAGLDDVLIIKNKAVTDATYSNILFKNGLDILTPATPLLKGTCRARLIAEKIIQETPISVNNIHQFPYFQLINAMNDFDESRWISTQNIVKDQEF